MKKFTVKDIMNKEPCPSYTEEVVTELWAGREELTFREVCTLDIDVGDRIWIAVRLASRATVVSWADYCVDEAGKHATATATAYWAAAAATNADYWAATATTNADYAADYAADAATYASNAATTAAAYWAADADWTKTRNEELERLLLKLVEMHEAEYDLTSGIT